MRTGVMCDATRIANIILKEVFISEGRFMNNKSGFQLGRVWVWV